MQLAVKLPEARVLLTGAGTSAYAASAVASAWPRALAIPTTDLLVDAERHLMEVDAVISLARSGDSPESAAVHGFSAIGKFVRRSYSSSSPTGAGRAAHAV